MTKTVTVQYTEEPSEEASKSNEQPDAKCSNPKDFVSLAAYKKRKLSIKSDCGKVFEREALEHGKGITAEVLENSKVNIYVNHEGYDAKKTQTNETSNENEKSCKHFRHRTLPVDISYVDDGTNIILSQNTVHVPQDIREDDDGANSKLSYLDTSNSNDDHCNNLIQKSVSLDNTFVDDGVLSNLTVEIFVPDENKQDSENNENKCIEEYPTNINAVVSEEKFPSTKINVKEKFLRCADSEDLIRRIKDKEIQEYAIIKCRRKIVRCFEYHHYLMIRKISLTENSIEILHLSKNGRWDICCVTENVDLSCGLDRLLDFDRGVLVCSETCLSETERLNIENRIKEIEEMPYLDYSLTEKDKFNCEKLVYYIRHGDKHVDKERKLFIEKYGKLGHIVVRTVCFAGSLNKLARNIRRCFRSPEPKPQTLTRLKKKLQKKTAR